MTVFRMLIPAAAAWLLAVVPAVVAAQEAAPVQDARTVARPSENPAAESAELGELLKSDALQYEKVIACKRLATIGTKEAVPALAALLSDEKMAHMARFALEPIPDPSVDAALRDALGELQGKLLVGVINSIGVRRDAEAVEALKKLISGTDQMVAGAAAMSLAMIANEQATQTLTEALNGPEPLRPAMADAALTCAERLLEQDKTDAAVALYDAIRKAELAPRYVIAATRGAILARGPEGAALVIELLKSDDPKMVGDVALRAARELEAKEVTAALVKELPELDPLRQYLVVLVLGDRRDKSALPAVVKAAKSESPLVRLAAVQALAKIGDASTVPVLLEAALAEEPVASAAQKTLAGLRGSEVDAAIAAALQGGDAKARRVVIDLIGRRRIASAVPALFKAADEADKEISTAALRALGETIAAEDVLVLAERLMNARSADEAAALQQALRAAAVRAADREAISEQLAATMAESSVEKKTAILEVLGTLGGPKALDVVSKAAQSGDAAIEDAATRVLGEWMSAEAGPALLELAKGSGRYQVRALRGYIRIARQLDMPPAERLGMTRQAMAVANRDEERRLVLDVLTRVPSPQSLNQAVEQLKSPTLKQDAGLVAVQIADKVVQQNPRAVAKAMQQVLDAGVTGDTAARAKALLDRASR